MKTEISTFCESALQALSSLPEALNDAAARMEQGSEKALLHEPLATLNDVRARLRSLVEKLSHQQAYLLIFGPLKSGKSTLMNAISGSYVSEVTSLPGYPCLVYVRHGEDAHFSATRYNGRETVFADGVVLKDTIADSHIALAQQIRDAELRGDSFDPGKHFSEAIRRIDIKLPVPALAESATVLVDTPGLYSRMNFGYDVLTREFRDSAACAVFVVKTDNLFLEQVFQEFNQLLDLFSRIFLVINVDTSKRDLQPDGSLQPSTESRNPEQIIEAFKTLSMAGPLRQAYEEGRVRIHAIDLLNAASAFLSRGGNGSNGGGERGAFDAFLADLTDYLNSSDYTRAFISDSLRQGYTLCEEAKAITSGDSFAQLSEKQAELARELSDIDERMAAIDRLMKVDWSATFERIRTENRIDLEKAATARAAQVGKDLHSALDRWFEGSDSFKGLEQRSWNLILREGGQTLADETRTRLRRMLGTPLGGAEPAASVMTDLHAVGFDLAPAGQSAMGSLGAQDATEPYAHALSTDSVPVRRSIGDWFLFRGAGTVKRRLFGDDLAREIMPDEKQKRLAEPSRVALRAIADEAVRDKFPALPSAYSERLLNTYVEKFCQEVTGGLKRVREKLEAERAERQAPHEANTQVLAAVTTLNERVTTVSEQLNALAEKEGVPPLFAPAAAPIQADEVDSAVPAVIPEPSVA